MENLKIIKNILHKIKIHPLTIFYGTFFLLMGDFLSFFFLGVLLLIHEIGHFLTAGILGCPLDKIYFYPFGGISKFQMDMNQSMKEEFLIIVMGPIFQILCYFMLLQIPFTKLHLDILTNIHYRLLFFNLLPIYPLDGGRLLLLFIQNYFSFYHSFQIIFFLSSCFITFFWFFFLSTKSLQYLFIFLLLLVTLFREIQKFPYYYEKFLLERFLKKYHFKKGKIVCSLKQFHRNKVHFVYQNGKYYEESEFLQKKFKKC